MTKIALIILAVFFQQSAMAGTEIRNYVEHASSFPGAAAMTLATQFNTLPAPVFSELVHEITGNRISVLLGYLSQAASNGNSEAQELIVITLYYYAKSDPMAELHRVKITDGQVSLSIPRVFCNVIEAGFPHDPKGWYAWFHRVNPHLQGFGKNDDEPRIWVLDAVNKPVSEILETVAKQSGMTIHYTPPKSGDPMMSFSGADVRTSYVFRDIARSAKMNVAYKANEVYFTPRE